MFGTKRLHFYLIFLEGKKKESCIGSRRRFVPLYLFVFERHSFTHRHSWHYGKDHYIMRRSFIYLEEYALEIRELNLNLDHILILGLKRNSWSNDSESLFIFLFLGYCFAKKNVRNWMKRISG